MALTKVSSSLVSDSAVTSGKIADGGVATADIATNAVTSTKIAQNSILTKHIDDGQVTTDQLGADAVTAAKIADDAISEEHLDVTVITSLTAVTAATGDLLMVADVSDSNNLKKIPVSSILAGTHTGAVNTSSSITSASSITAASGGNEIQIGTDGNIEITRTSGGAYIDFKNSTSEDFDQRLQIVSGNFNFTASGLSISGSEFIDSSRNIDIGSSTISSGAITSTGLLTLTGASILLNDGSNNNEQSVRIQNSTVTGYFGVEGSSANRFSGSSANNMFLGTTTADGIEFATNNTVRATINSSGAATFNDSVTAGSDIEIRSGNKLILQRPNNAVASIISTDSTGAMILDSLNSEGFFFNNNGTNIFKLDPVNATFTGNSTAANQIATTSVYSNNGVYYGASTLDLKDSSAASFLSFASNKNATFAGTISATKSVTVGNTSVGSSTTNYENVLRIKGKNNYSNGTTWYGDYGQLIFDATSNMTGSARKIMLTNAYDNNRFAIVQSVDANTDPVVNSTGNGVNSGVLLLDFQNDKTATFGGQIITGGNVGIGETSPDRQLHVKSGTTNVVAKFESTDQIAAIEFTDSGGSAEIGCDGSDVVLFPAGSEKFRVQNSTGYLVAQSASQVRLVLGSTGNSSNNTSNWIRGTGNELGLNSGGGNIGIEIGGSAKATINTTGQILANPLGVTVPTFAFIGDTNTGMTRPTGDTLQFVTGGSARWRINSSGHLVPENQHTYDIGGTNAEVRNIYAQGISFASNANESGMSSELLDDYEEGVYDATISCASGSITLYTSYTRLRYTKIGRQVHIHGKLAVNSVSSPTGATNLNLPFASANDTNRAGVANNIMTGYFNGSAVTTGIYPIYGDLAEASSVCRLFVMVTPATHNLGDNYTAQGTDYHINFTYTTT